MMKQRLLPVLAAVASGTASAHEGHGLPGASHWHASDAWGFALVAALGVAMLVWGRRK